MRPRQTARAPVRVVEAPQIPSRRLKGTLRQRRGPSTRRTFHENRSIVLFAQLRYVFAGRGVRVIVSCSRFPLTEHPVWHDRSNLTNPPRSPPHGRRIHSSSFVSRSLCRPALHWLPVPPYAGCAQSEFYPSRHHAERKLPGSTLRMLARPWHEAFPRTRGVQVVD